MSLMIEEPKPHRLTAKVDKWGEVTLMLDCPYKGEPRPCTYGIEAQRCDWQDYQDGKHHDDCPQAKDRSAECSALPGSATGCWPAEPEECDGFYSGEVGHCHPTDGCWAQEIIGELGWSEAIRWWPKQELDLVLPTDVSVSCDEEGVTLSLWAGAQSGRTEGDGST